MDQELVPINTQATIPVAELITLRVMHQNEDIAMAIVPTRVDRDVGFIPICCAISGATGPKRAMQNMATISS